MDYKTVIKTLTMRKTELALVFILGFILFSCQSKFDLKSDKQLNEIFTDKEISEIDKMISYVDDIVVEQTGNRDINEGYHQLLDKQLQSMDDGSSYIIPIEEEEKYKFLESVDSTVFNEFWYMGNHIRFAKYKDSVYQDLDNYKYLSIKYRSKYKDYLEKIGENDSYYRSVKENLDLAGGVSPYIVFTFLNVHSEFDFNIPKNRLWATVFLLAIEESNDKKMERYLNQKNPS